MPTGWNEGFSVAFQGHRGRSRGVFVRDPSAGTDCHGKLRLLSAENGLPRRVHKARSRAQLCLSRLGSEVPRPRVAFGRSVCRQSAVSQHLLYTTRGRKPARAILGVGALSSARSGPAKLDPVQVRIGMKSDFRGDGLPQEIAREVYAVVGGRGGVIRK